MVKLDITAIVLTLNEELHIKRCIENLNQYVTKVYVIDCFSTDNTCEFALALGATVVKHKWPGNQAAQFNWAIDTLDIKTEWILRLDADEYLTPELISELEARLLTLPKDVSACVFPLGRAFHGRILKHGIVNNVSMIRLFRTGQARYEQRIMDEHLNVLGGSICSFSNKFIDDNLLPISKFIEKHNGYSTKEAIVLLDEEFHLDLFREEASNDDRRVADEVSKKREQKSLYSKLPLFHRAFWYFVYRYIIRFGFLDGKEGFEWDFFQGLWYRMLVDSKVYEIKKSCKNNPELIREHIRHFYGYMFNDSL